MPYMQWNEKLLTGIRQFDEHHHYLVDLLNKTYDDFIGGAPDEFVEAVLRDLIEYAGYHFAAEENWMREISYPKLAAHKSEHDSFLQSVQALQSGLSSGREHIFLEVLMFLKRWIRDHLIDSDAGYRSSVTPPPRQA